MQLTRTSAQSPLFKVNYRRGDKVYTSTEDLFAHWTPDTLDKTLYKEDAKVAMEFTQLRPYTVKEALKSTLSDVAPGVFVVTAMSTALGIVGGAMAGSPMTGALVGAGLGLGTMATAGTYEYLGYRNGAGTTSVEHSGYAYREKPGDSKVKLVEGLDLVSYQGHDGSVLAACTPDGFFQVTDLGRIPA